MKSVISCACVGVLFLVSSVAEGTVVKTGDWVETSSGGDGGVSGGWGASSATVYTTGYTASYGYASAEGWEQSYTTEPQWKSYWCKVYAWAEAELVLWSGFECVSVADVFYANADAPDGFSCPYAASVHYEWESGTWGRHLENFDGVYQYYQVGSAYFGPGSPDDALCCEHSVGACGIVWPSQEDVAFAHACGRAYGGIYE